MKSRFLLPLLGLCALSCHDMPYEEAQSDEMTLLKASVARCETRTWLDSANPTQTEDGENYSVYWSDGDRVNVNGQVSSPLSVLEDAKILQAEFALKSVQPPYNVIYPSSIVTGEGYAEGGSVEVTIPSQQKYSPSTFAQGAAVLYGYALAADEVVQLQNACAAVRVSLKGEDLISDVCLLSKGAPLAGKFFLNPQEGTLIPAEYDTVKEISLTDVSGQLSGEGCVDFYFTVPAGDYSEGFEFSFWRGSDRRKMLCNWTPKSKLEAGRMYCFDDVEFVPGAKDIECAEDWNAFVEALNSGTGLDLWIRKGVATVGKDFTIENPAKVTSKTAYNIDGKNHTITVSQGTGPLFRGVRGRIENLTIAGEFKIPGKEVSVFADTLHVGGSIVNCTNKATLTSTFAGAQYGGGIVRVISGGGTIKGCKNEGEITLNPDASNGFVNCYIGGIVGQIAQNQQVTIVDCSNNAKITVNPKITNAEYNITCAGIGGIAGWVRYSNGNVTFDNCDNLSGGSITLSADNITVAAKQSSVCVGGIVGIAAGYNPEYHALSTPNTTNGLDVTMTGCDNSGNIYNCVYAVDMAKYSNVKVYTGGLAGALLGKEAKRISVSGCSVTDCSLIPYDIVGGTQKAGYSSVVGGMIGFGGYVDIDGCKSNPIIGNGKRQSVSFAGVLGFALKPFTLKNSYIWTEGYFNRIPGYQNNRASIAVVPTKYNGESISPAGNITGSEITDCHVGGVLYVSQKTYEATNTDDLSSYCTDKTVGATLFDSLDKFRAQMVFGQGYTANTGVTISGIQSWNGIL